MTQQQRQSTICLVAACATCIATLAGSTVLQHKIADLRTRLDTVQAEVQTTQDWLDRATEQLETVTPLEPAPVAEELAAVEEPEPVSLGTFKLTAYCPCEKCCGEWADGFTYTGTVATAGRTVAVDPSVIPLGSTVRINGHDYIAEDIGGAIKENRIDVFFDSHQAALQFGVQYADVAIIQ